MQSYTTRQYRVCFAKLPAAVKRTARAAFRKWQTDPFHPGLHFKPIRRNHAIYSVRITRDWRALGVREGDKIAWFWIGSHAEYDRLVSTL
jgi:hypothetical protein